MLPVFAIVGRPNVGKSTLYNRLTQTKDALVSDMPGVTRDRHYGEGKCGERSFIVVDTGGIAEPDDKDMAFVTEEQARIAMNDADVILFILDAQAGIANADWIIAQQLRELKNKKIVLVVNKSEHEATQHANAEFYSLGFKTLFSIAASNGRGIEAMMIALLSEFPEDKTEKLVEEDHTRTRIAVLGRPNVGKSTLINRLLGEERVVVFDRPGTTRDSIEIPYEHHGKKYTLIDTAGIRRRTKIEEGIEIFSVIKAIQAMKQSHVVIVVIDAREGLTDQDMRLIGLVVECGNALVLAFNKWDGMSLESREQFKNAVDRRLPFAHYARRYHISAKHGTGVGLLYDAVDETQKALSQPFATHELTQILMAATEAHQPPLAQGRRVKLRYAHVGCKRPLTFVVHGKQVNKLHGSYQQFLINFFRDKLNLTGIPLVVKFVGDDNPYVTKV